MSSALNQKVDWQSSNTQDSSQWQLSLQIFSKTSEVLGQPRTDLFSFRFSNRTPVCFSWKSDHPMSRDRCNTAGQATSGESYTVCIPPVCPYPISTEKGCTGQGLESDTDYSCWHTQA